MTTPQSVQTLREQVSAHRNYRQVLRITAAEILEHHHRASAMEIAFLLLDAAGVEVEP